MYLKRIEIVGFKSFADRTELEFFPGVTAIVGPNGSGKSNISDCIRWVLGEQSAKSLRGVKMEDVIFSGSDTRKPVNYCEVSLTLDNGDQTLGLDYSEVTVTRRVYRSGEGEYLINKQACRLKDITELFMDTGIGKEAYSIIGQGRIEEILSTKAEDRRGIFEEAAGIVKYKVRKREAEKKLEETEANLLRIGDIIAELESQMGPLSEQARIAEMYRKRKEELDRIEISLYVYEIEDLHTRWLECSQIGKDLQQQQIAQSAVVSQEEASYAELRWLVDQLEHEWEEKNSKIVEVVTEFEKAEGRREVLRERMRNLLQGREDVTGIRSKLAKERKTIESEWAQQQEQATVLRKKRAEFIQELEDKQDQVKGFLDRAEKEEALERMKGDLIEKLNDAAGKRNEIKNIQAQREMLFRREERLQEDHKELVMRVQSLEKTIKEAQTQAEQYREQEEHSQQRFREQQSTLLRLNEEAKMWEKKLQDLKNEYASCQSRFELMRDMQQEYGGYNTGVRHILQAAKAGKVTDVCGAVAEKIHVPATYEIAMETALGGALQHVIVETEKAGREAIHYLKQHGGGRATFLPLDVMKGRHLAKGERGLLEGHPGFVGIAAEMVTCEEKYREIVNYLLGSVVVAKTLAHANKLARLLQYRLRVVTLDGDLVNPGGSMTGGSLQKKGTSLLGRQREVEELGKQVSQLKAMILDAQKQIERIEMEMRGVQEEKLQEQIARAKEGYIQIDSYIRESSAEKRGIEERLQMVSLELKQCRQEMSDWKMRQEQAEGELATLELDIRELTQQVEELQNTLREQMSVQEDLSEELTEVKVKLAGIDQEILGVEMNIQRLQQRIQEISEELETKEREYAAIEQRMGQAKEEMAECESQVEFLAGLRTSAQEELDVIKTRRNQLNKKTADAEHRLREARIVLRNLENQVHQNEVKENRLDVELTNSLTQLAEEYHISYELAKERYPVPEDISGAKKQVSRLRSEIEELGEVNLGAVEEYKRICERFAFLCAQRDDLIEAKTKLYEVIHDIEEEMCNRFLQSFTAIREQFTDVFAQLFGGGKADLQLVNPEQLLTTGVDIVAQPPGKKLQNLSLLSGGERALTAISLLFAILRVKPVPFCVLDEVEAALDEANVSRFAEYLRACSSQTQFIVITHRKGTMESADVLYGITMEESGVSKLVSVKLIENEVQTA